MKVTEYNIHNGAISTSVKIMWSIFAISFIISEILTLQICDLQNFGQDNVVHIFAIVPFDDEYQPLYKSHIENFSPLLIVYPHFKFYDH